ncbi:hypothetical protein Gpo141_00002772 [Globisporangium polare]
MEMPRRTGRFGLMTDNEHRTSLSVPKGPSSDVRKRMDDIYGEMEQSWKNGRFRLPLKFVSFHESGKLAVSSMFSSTCN